MIRLLIADDHQLVREGIKRIIEQANNITLVGEADNGNDVLRLMRTEAVDILLLDISMPGPGFLEIMHRLKAPEAPYRVLILSAQSEEQYAIRSLKAGASGYLTKNHSPEELLIAIQHIHQGGRYISQSLGEKLADTLLLDSETQSPIKTLSDREYQIFCMLAGGVKGKEIAETLSISPKTVSTYRARIFDKMGFKNQAELILYAIKNGIVE